jgi:hypothetical protein
MYINIKDTFIGSGGLTAGSCGIKKDNEFFYGLISL